MRLSATASQATALGVALLSVTVVTGVAHAQDLLDDRNGGSLVRFFIDSGKVSVRSFIQDVAVPLPNTLGLSLHWNNEKVTIPAISAPPGSSEAVDAITTASRPISNDAFSDFVKVRNELSAGLSRGPTVFEYYHSSEADYLAQQVGARWNRDFRGQQLNLAVGGSYGWDDIQPLDDDDTMTPRDTRGTVHGNVVATGIFSPTTVVRVGLEHNDVHGLQHNPYRHVYAGGTSVAERHPEHRQRTDTFVKVNQYLPNRSSVKLHYRLYGDDWGIVSHEIGTRLSQYLTRGLYAQYQYRWYTQTPADFYRPEYATTGGVGGYLTWDYRMGPLASHLFGFALEADLGVLAAESRWLRQLGVSLDYERYFNSNNYSADILETGVVLRF